jgi:hypothetical protein
VNVYKRIRVLRPAGIGTVLAIVSVGASATSALAPSAPSASGSTDSVSATAPQSAPESSAAPVPLGSDRSAAAHAGALSANELAREISNPVTDLWQLQFQFNNEKLESRTGDPFSDKWANNLYFQPVLPVSLTKDLNLITRPVITAYQSLPYITSTGDIARTTTLGDTILAQVLSPTHTEPWIFGAGPTWIFPTARSDLTGQGRWQVGPAVGGGYVTDKFMVASLVQQWWSFAGDGNGDRTHADHTNQVNILPLVYRFWGEGWSVGYSGAITADWTAPGRNVWTVPVGVSVGKVIRLGILPVQIQIGGQYFAASPMGGPKWNLQLQLTPVIPRLIQKTLFP